MRVRKFVISLVACCLGLMFLTAVASAVPADRPAAVSSAQGGGAVMIKPSFTANVYAVATPGPLLMKLGAFAPSAEPMTLLLFGTALIGAARMARRRSVELQ
jgi:hypothetical protein